MGRRQEWGCSLLCWEMGHGGKNNPAKGVLITLEGSRCVFEAGVRVDSRLLFFVLRMLSFCAGIFGSLGTHCGPRSREVTTNQRIYFDLDP